MRERAVVSAPRARRRATRGTATRLCPSSSGVTGSSSVAPSRLDVGGDAAPGRWRGGVGRVETSGPDAAVVVEAIPAAERPSLAALAPAATASPPVPQRCAALPGSFPSSCAACRWIGRVARGLSPTVRARPSPYRPRRGTPCRSKRSRSTSARRDEGLRATEKVGRRRAGVHRRGEACQVQLGEGILAAPLPRPVPTPPERLTRGARSERGWRSRERSSGERAARGGAKGWGTLLGKVWRTSQGAEYGTMSTGDDFPRPLEDRAAPAQDRGWASWAG
jgi:hypothetical protein